MYGKSKPLGVLFMSSIFEGGRERPKKRGAYLI